MMTATVIVFLLALAIWLALHRAVCGGWKPND
jgi:hypothetical protein